jgi:hypothetical protein
MEKKRGQQLERQFGWTLFRSKRASATLGSEKARVPKACPDNHFKIGLAEGQRGDKSGQSRPDFTRCFALRIRAREVCPPPVTVEVKGRWHGATGRTPANCSPGNIACLTAFI